jgi:hypothetical protein
MWRERILITLNFNGTFFIQGIAFGILAATFIERFHGPHWIPYAVLYALIALALWRSHATMQRARAVARNEWEKLRREAWEVGQIALPEKMPEDPTGWAMLRTIVTEQMERWSDR